MSVHRRGEVGGMLRVLLATLFLLAQTIAQAQAAPAGSSPADAIELLALQTLCHGAPSDDKSPVPTPTHQHDCLLCPACHLAGHALILAPGGPVVFPPGLAFIGLAAPPPDQTGPPLRHRVSAQPTGPPAISA